MIFAQWRRLHWAELSADFQETYHLDINRTGKDFSAVHAANLAVMLPQNSRVYRKIEPAAAWTLDISLLTAAVNALNTLVWLEADPKRRKSNRPKPIKPPNVRANSEKELLTADEYKKKLQSLYGR